MFPKHLSSINIFETKILIIISQQRDLSGGPVFKNPSSNAKDMGWIPGWEAKLPYAQGQLSPHATITEPACSRRCTTTREKPVHQKRRAHALLQKTPHTVRKILRATAKTL